MTSLAALAALWPFLRLAAPALARGRWPNAFDASPQGLLWSGLGVAVLAALFRPELAPAIAAAIALHEYGHVIGYRLAGHAAPRFRLAPLGGLAMSAEAPKDETEIAFVALMGPGFSLAGVLALAALTAAAGQAGSSLAAPFGWALTMLGVLNLANLAPLGPLDGGRALSAIASLGGPAASRVVGLTAGLALAGAAIQFGAPLLLPFALIGALSALQTRHGPALAPMRLGPAALALATYAALIAAHGFAARPALRALGLDV